jgi:hypothetical protein
MEMSKIILAPIKLVGWAAAGLAFAAGWKLGSYVGDLATGEKKIEWPVPGIWMGKEEPEPLWKRKFSRITVE